MQSGGGGISRSSEPETGHQSHLPHPRPEDILALQRGGRHLAISMVDPVTLDPVTLDPVTLPRLEVPRIIAGGLVFEEAMNIKYTVSKKPLVDTIEVDPVHSGQCHCGGVKFTVRLPNGLVDPRRCNCSMCRRRGAVVASVALKDLTIDEGQDLLSLYQFNTHTAKHYFCSRCGIYTHHQRRSNPALYAINIACLNGVDPLVLRNVAVLDGEDHPSDRVDGV